MTNGKSPFTIPPGIAAAVALIVAALAAVGVSGDALTRAVRNEPEPLAWAVTIALAAAVVAAALVSRNWAVRVGLLVILIAVGWAVWLGAESVANREQPLVALSLSSEDTGSKTLTVEVSASGLRTTDEILVQVIGLKKFTQVDEATVGICEQSWAFTSAAPERYRGLPAGSGTLLLWDRIGPDPTGKVETTIKIPVPSGQYQGICAWVPLPSRSGNTGDVRNSAAYLTVTAPRALR